MKILIFRKRNCNKKRKDSLKSSGILLLLPIIIISCKPINLESFSNEAQSCKDREYCNIFFTESAHDGNFGGIEGADELCQNSLNRPNSSTYKAMIVSSQRIATINNQTDWVLMPLKEYRRLDGTIIGTTLSSSTFGPPLTNDFGSPNASDGIFTGLHSDWSSSVGNCNDWTSNSSSDSTSLGFTNQVFDSLAWSDSTGNCSQFQSILCVEQ